MDIPEKAIRDAVLASDGSTAAVALILGVSQNTARSRMRGLGFKFQNGGYRGGGRKPSICRDELLGALDRCDGSTDLAASVLGRAKRYVLEAMKREGIAIPKPGRRPVVVDRAEKEIALTARTVDDAAKHLGYHRDTLRRYMKRLGIPGGRQRTSWSHFAGRLTCPAAAIALRGPASIVRPSGYRVA